MAVEVESTSQIEEFLRVLKKRVWWIIIPFALVGTLGSSFAVIVPKKYVAMTRVMVRDDERNEKQRGVLGNQSEEGKVAKHFIRSPQRIKTVLDDLDWPEWNSLEGDAAQEYLTGIKDALEVGTPAMPQGSRQQLVEISFSHTQGDLAADFVRGIFSKWKKDVLDRSKNKAIKVFESVKKQRSELQKQFLTVTDQITMLRSENDIAPPTVNKKGEALASGAGSIWQRIGEDELAKARLGEEIEALKMGIAEARDRHDAMGDEVLDVRDIQGLSFQPQIEVNRSEILALNQELTRQGYKARHPRYKEIQRTVADLQEQIAQLEAAQSGVGTQETTTANYDKLDLKEQIELDESELAKKVASHARLQTSIRESNSKGRALQAVLSQIYKLEVERDRAEEALTLLEADFQERLARHAGLESRDSDPFEVLDPVRQPTRPTEPNPVLIVLFSIFAGLALGLALAVITEYSRSCFRSVNDVTRVMVVPVLGTVNAIVTKSQLRRRLAGRFVMGGATLGFVLVVGFITWAFDQDQRFLSGSMIESIESFREALK